MLNCLECDYVAAEQCFDSDYGNVCPLCDGEDVVEVEDPSAEDVDYIAATYASPY